MIDLMQHLEYLCNTVWYIEGRDTPDGAMVSAGSAVAIMLTPKTGPTNAYLLTCSHVIRRNLTGACLTHLRAWIPGKDYFPPPKGGFEVIKAHSPLIDHAVDDNSISGANDWVLLQFLNEKDGAAIETVEAVARYRPDGLYAVFGHPSHYNFSDRVKATPRLERIPHDVLKGIIQLSGDPNRRGMSGGAVFDGSGELVGLHRASDNERLKLKSIEVRHIIEQLQSTGLRFEPRRLRCEETTQQINRQYMHVSTIPQTRSPCFDLRITLCGHRFEDVLAIQKEGISPKDQYVTGRDLKPAEFLAMLRSATQRAFLLQAPGGSGKTAFLTELLRTAPKFGIIPYLLNFATAPVASEDDKLNLASWGARYMTCGKLDDLKIRDPEFMKLLVVDGINQAAGGSKSQSQIQFVEERLAVLEQLARADLAHTAMVVTDRLTYRGPDKFALFHLATIHPLTRAAYSDVLKNPALVQDDDWHPLLSSPLFLDLILKVTGNEPGGVPPNRISRSAVLRQFLRQSGFSPKQIETLAAFAYRMYRLHGSTEFELEEAKSALSDMWQQIDKENLIIPMSGTSFGSISTGAGNAKVGFRHQLFQDYFSALHVISACGDEQDVLLSPDSFNVLTLGTSSPDAIELGVEALHEGQQLPRDCSTPLTVEKFVSEVYDWNYWLALQGLLGLEGRGGADPPVPMWMRHAIYALNLEKRFEWFRHSSIRSERLQTFLNGIPHSDYRSASDRASLVQMVRAEFATGVLTSGRAQEWLKLYIGEASLSRVDDLEVLAADPVLSWTAANTIRRSRASGQIADTLMLLYKTSFATAPRISRAQGYRWRIVHALGRSSTPAVGQFLQNVICQPLETVDVRYGAIRSLIEIIIANASQEWAIDRLHSAGGLIPQFCSVRALSRELRRCCAVNEEAAKAEGVNLAAWLDRGLCGYVELLTRGAEWARGQSNLADEALEWQRWREAAETAHSNREREPWEMRRQRWDSLILV